MPLNDAYPKAEGCKLGSELAPEVRREALRSFVHRYTKDHVPTWARRKDGSWYPVQHASDAEWLANTWFRVNKNGNLRRGSHCYSCPTWPDNPELLPDSRGIASKAQGD